jgi:heme exporter protein D
MNLGPHAVYIWGAYGAMTIGLGGLVAWLILDNFKQRASLADLDARGVKRRTSGGDGTADAG